MDLDRRLTRGRRLKLAFGGGVLFCTFCLLWFDGLLPVVTVSRYLPLPPCRHRIPSDQASDMEKKRFELYENMAADLDNRGALFLNGGETSQSLKLADLFKIVDGKVTPVLKPANPPVRANILHLQHRYASKIADAVQSVLSPHFSKGVWYQDPQLYHFSLFHASHHLEPVSATQIEVHGEFSAVEQVAKTCCPLEIVLERVVLTSTGVLLGCWQVLNGTDPTSIRTELSKALSQAPKTQLYAPEILHSSFARIFAPPDFSTERSVIETSQSVCAESLAGSSEKETIAKLKALVQRLNDKLCNFQATVTELWYVEEVDILALALSGRILAKRFPLKCPQS